MSQPLSAFNAYAKATLLARLQRLKVSLAEVANYQKTQMLGQTAFLRALEPVVEKARQILPLKLDCESCGHTMLHPNASESCPFFRRFCVALEKDTDLVQRRNHRT
jgi:rubrerythrin